MRTKINKLIAIFLILGPLHHISAQENLKSKTSLEATMGLSMPLGKFAKDSPDDPESGYANVGMNYKFALAHHFDKFMGVFGLFHASDHRFDLRQQFLDVNMNGDYELYSFEAGKWKSHAFVGGLLFFHQVDNFKIETRFGYGRAKLTCPEIIMKGSGSESGIEVTQYESTEAGFAYLIGIGTHIFVTENIGASFRLDFFHTKMEFNAPISYDKLVGTNHFTQPIDELDLNVGISYYF